MLQICFHWEEGAVKKALNSLVPSDSSESFGLSGSQVRALLAYVKNIVRVFSKVAYDLWTSCGVLYSLQYRQFLSAHPRGLTTCRSSPSVFPWGFRAMLVTKNLVPAVQHQSGQDREENTVFLSKEFCLLGP